MGYAVPSPILPTGLLASRGRIVDGLVLAAGIVAVGPLAGVLGHLGHGFLADDAGDARALWTLILCAFASYTLGVLIRPRRASEIGDLPPFTLFIPLALLFGLCILGAAFTLFGLGVPEPWGLAGSLALALVPPSAVAWSVLRPSCPPRGQAPVWREATGDTLLIGAILVCSTIWSAGLLRLFSDVAGPLSTRAATALTALVAFSLFYVAVRIAFLVEDARDRKTWLTICLAGAPVAVRVLVD